MRSCRAHRTRGIGPLSAPGALAPRRPRDRTSRRQGRDPPRGSARRGPGAGLRPRQARQERVGRRRPCAFLLSPYFGEGSPSPPKTVTQTMGRKEPFSLDPWEGNSRVCGRRPGGRDRREDQARLEGSPGASSPRTNVAPLLSSVWEVFLLFFLTQNQKNPINSYLTKEIRRGRRVLEATDAETVSKPRQRWAAPGGAGDGQGWPGPRAWEAPSWAHRRSSCPSGPRESGRPVPLRPREAPRGLFEVWAVREARGHALRQPGFGGASPTTPFPSGSDSRGPEHVWGLMAEAVQLLTSHGHLAVTAAMDACTGLRERPRAPRSSGQGPPPRRGARRRLPPADLGARPRRPTEAGARIRERERARDPLPTWPWRDLRGIGRGLEGGQRGWLPGFVPGARGRLLHLLGQEGDTLRGGNLSSTSDVRLRKLATIFH